MKDERLAHLTTFYSLLARLEERIDGARTLVRCTGRTAWPIRGVYFFRECGEHRADATRGTSHKRCSVRRMGRPFICGRDQAMIGSFLDGVKKTLLNVCLRAGL